MIRTPQQPARHNVLFALFGSSSRILRSYWGDWRADLGQMWRQAGGPAVGTFALVLIPGSLATFLLVLGGALLLALAGLFLLLTMLVLRLMALARQLFNQVFYTCPYCQRRIAYPHHCCPGCGVEHTHLFPSIYGIFSRTCQCGYELPTLESLGLSALAKYCSHCKGRLPTGAGVAADRHLALIGGPSTGKTSFLLQATRVMLSPELAAARARLANPEQVALFEAGAERLRRGRPVPRAVEDSPVAFTFQLARAGRSSLVYLYDTPGEMVRSQELTVGRGLMLAHLDALCLLIDPFALPALGQRHGRSIAKLAYDLAPSRLDPRDVLERVINALDRHAGVRKPGESFQMPIAVLLTKWDALQQIVADDSLRIDDPAAAQADAACRQLLELYDEGALVELLIRNFRRVRFFPLSALGRMPSIDNTTPFQPWGVAPAVQWMIEQIEVGRSGSVKPASASRPGRRLAVPLVIGGLLLLAGLLFHALSGDRSSTAQSERKPTERQGTDQITRKKFAAAAPRAPSPARPAPHPPAKQAPAKPGPTTAAAPPLVLKITEPAAGLITSARQIWVKGTIDQQTRALQVNGQPASVQGRSFQALVRPRVEGSFRILVRAVDRANRETTAQRSITCDWTPPVLKISSPAPGLTTRASTITVSGTVDEIASITVNGRPASRRGPQFEALVRTGIETGERQELTIRLQAADRAGNVTTRTITVTVDPAAVPSGFAGHHGYSGSPPRRLRQSTRGRLSWTGVLGDPRFKHGASVRAVAFSPDGRGIASGSIDRTVKVWDARSGRTLHTLSGHEKAVRALAYSPDGTTIVSASYDGTLKVWRASSGVLLRTLSGHQGGVIAVAFGPGGSLIASAGNDKTVKVWGAKTGRLLQTLTGHAHAVYAVAFHPAGPIVSGSQDMRLVRWDPGRGYWQSSSRGRGSFRHSNSVFAVACSPDGRLVASGGADNQIKLWRWLSYGSPFLDRTLSGHTADVNALAFSRDGKRLVSASDDNTIKVWEAKEGNLLRTLKGHAGDVNAVAFSPRGKQIVSAGDDGTIKLWDARSGALHRLPGVAGHDDDVWGVALSPDGRRIASGSRDDTVKVWDAGSGTLLHTMTGHGSGVAAVAFSPDGRRIVSGSSDNTVKVWDARDGRELRTLKGHKEPVYDVAFSPDGRRIASAGRDRQILIWDGSRGRSLRRLTGHTDRIRSVAFFPDGRYIVSGSKDRTIKLWDARTGRLLHTFTGHTGGVNAVAVTAGGKQILSASEDRTIRLWDARGRKLLRTFAGHTGGVNAVAVTAGGKHILSAGDDRTIRLWDVSTGRLLDSIGVDSRPWSLALHGRLLVAGCANTTICRYRLSLFE